MLNLEPGDLQDAVQAALAAGGDDFEFEPGDDDAFVAAAADDGAAPAAARA